MYLNYFTNLLKSTLKAIFVENFHIYMTKITTFVAATELILRSFGDLISYVMEK